MGKLAGKDDEIIKQYLNGKSAIQLGKEYNCHYDSIYGVLKRNHIEKRHRKSRVLLSPKQKDEMIEKYFEGENLSSLSKYFNCNETLIYSILKEKGINKRRNVYAPVNKHYFDKIDHQNKAYILGFFYGDSCNSREIDVITTTLAIKDKEILEKFKNILSTPEKKLYINKENTLVTLRLHNKHLSEQLEKLGMMARKTFKIRVPFEDIKGYEAHFVRGYF